MQVFLYLFQIYLLYYKHHTLSYQDIYLYKQSKNLTHAIVLLLPLTFLVSSIFQKLYFYFVLLPKYPTFAKISNALESDISK